VKYWRIAERPDERQLEEIAQLLSAGGVVLMPTDTIYGLHAAATNERAVRAIASMKARDDAKPFIVLAGSLEQIDRLGAVASEKTRAALAEIWPAPLTVILPLVNPIAASRGSPAIGVRIPAISWLRELLMSTGPLASTSANESGAAPAIRPGEVSGNVLAGLDGIVDAGTIEGIASAIVDLTGHEPRLVRAGESLFTQEVWKTLRKTL
jgi:L-threonylcarbamoyladenylate synthase